MAISSRLLQIESLAKLVRTSNTVVTLGSLTVTTSISGVNGLDTGTIAASTMYYVYAVNSSGIKLVASTSAVAPTGFTGARKVGAFYTDGSSNVFKAYYFGEQHLAYYSASMSGNSLVAQSLAGVFSASSGTNVKTITLNSGFFAATPTVSSAGSGDNAGAWASLTINSATNISLYCYTGGGSPFTPVNWYFTLTKQGIDAVIPDWTR